MKIRYEATAAEISDVARSRASSALAEARVSVPHGSEISLARELHAWDPQAPAFDAWSRFVATYGGMVLAIRGKPYFDATTPGFRTALENVDPRDVVEWAALVGEDGLLPVAQGHLECVWLIGSSGRLWYVFPWAEAVGLSDDFALEVARFEQRALDMTPATK